MFMNCPRVSRVYLQSRVTPDCAITFQTPEDEIWFLRMCHHISKAGRRNLFSAHVPSHLKRSKTKSGFCACAITFKTPQDEIWFLRMCHHISNAARRNLVSAHVPSHYKRTLPPFLSTWLSFATSSLRRVTAQSLNQ